MISREKFLIKIMNRLLTSKIKEKRSKKDFKMANTKKLMNKCQKLKTTKILIFKIMNLIKMSNLWGKKQKLKGKSKVIGMSKKGNMRGKKLIISMIISLLLKKLRILNTKLESFRKSMMKKKKVLKNLRRIGKIWKVRKMTNKIRKIKKVSSKKLKMMTVLMNWKMRSRSWKKNLKMLKRCFQTKKGLWFNHRYQLVINFHLIISCQLETRCRRRLIGNLHQITNNSLLIRKEIKVWQC